MTSSSKQPEEWERQLSALLHQFAGMVTNMEGEVDAIRSEGFQYEVTLISDFVTKLLLSEREIMQDKLAQTIEVAKEMWKDEGRIAERKEIIKELEGMEVMGVGGDFGVGF